MNFYKITIVYEFLQNYNRYMDFYKIAIAYEFLQDNNSI